MLKGFIDGATAYGRAVGIISKYKLWGYVVIPAIISVLLAFGIFRAIWSWSDNLGHWMAGVYPFDWGHAVVEKTADVIGGFLIAALGLLIFKQVVMAIASPFMSFLSETVEKRLVGAREAKFTIPNMLNDLWRGIRISLRNIWRELLFTLLCVFLGFIPVFSPFVPFAIFFIQAYYAGFGNLDFTLERYYNVGNSVHFVRNHRGLALGNGTIFMLLLLTGVGFLFALPLGTVAGATETLKRLPR